MVSEKDKQTLVEMGFERYFTQSALLGTPETCLNMIKKLFNAGVTEVCALVNFGLNYETIFKGLKHLNTLRLQSQEFSRKVETV